MGLGSEFAIFSEGGLGAEAAEVCMSFRLKAALGWSLPPLNRLKAELRTVGALILALRR